MQPLPSHRSLPADIKMASSESRQAWAMAGFPSVGGSSFPLSSDPCHVQGRWRRAPSEQPGKEFPCYTGTITRSGARCRGPSANWNIPAQGWTPRLVQRALKVPAKDQQQTPADALGPLPVLQPRGQKQSFSSQILPLGEDSGRLASQNPQDTNGNHTCLCTYQTPHPLWRPTHTDSDRALTSLLEYTPRSSRMSQTRELALRFQP